ncbi:hypothetical protein [Flammeovirga kamogawensis]|uniref:Uncharacterized protein n=1 Tax=Flammeovirga kamogawensis TaxID=373891 RepID=A0ABX8GPW9_9BACT|nr:hypothetical protein [Flammeovirga kamogawensis]MBB6463420.1 chromosome segregation ATPase [Flammeovirga kamogawensis]QWG05653.1 hypothetical protein KM029_09685 [Flammeovirga kamogawensis]TRX67484.1 hypothetical protein EO216_04720 [Flammeovirga kamogawensis]
MKKIFIALSLFISLLSCSKDKEEKEVENESHLMALSKLSTQNRMDELSIENKELLDSLKKLNDLLAVQSTLASPVSTVPTIGTTALTTPLTSPVASTPTSNVTSNGQLLGKLTTELSQIKGAYSLALTENKKLKDDLKKSSATKNPTTLSQIKAYQANEMNLKKQVDQLVQEKKKLKSSSVNQQLQIQQLQNDKGQLEFTIKGVDMQKNAAEKKSQLLENNYNALKIAVDIELKKHKLKSNWIPSQFGEVLKITK